MKDATKMALGELFNAIRDEYGPTAMITLCNPSAFAYRLPCRRYQRSTRRAAVQAKRKRLGLDSAGRVPVTDPLYQEIAQHYDAHSHLGPYRRVWRGSKKKFMRQWREYERRYRLDWGMAAYDGMLAEKLCGGK
jgi:hypothetical protein